MRKEIFKISLVLFLIFTLKSCQHYLVNEAGYIRPPKEFKFEYKNHLKKLENTNVIDTAALYISKGNYIYYDSAHVIKKQFLRENYFRFFSDGKFKRGSLAKLNRFPEDMNNIKTGGIGYYLIKDNSVYLEFYSDIEAGSSQLQYAEIDEDKNLKIFSGNPRTYTFLELSKFYNPKPLKKENFEIYKKVKNTNIKYVKPDW